MTSLIVDSIQQGPFLKVPVELIDVIISSIDRESDLLSFALTCSFFHARIIPRHLFYRTIRCSPAEGYRLWKALERDVDLASNIRKVEMVAVFDERTGCLEKYAEPYRGPIVPEFMGIDRTLDPNKTSQVFNKGPMFTTAMLDPFNIELPSSCSEVPHDNNLISMVDSCEGTFVQALTKMKNLVRFTTRLPVQHWKQHLNSPFHGKSEEHPANVDIWEILGDLPCLTELDIKLDIISDESYSLSTSNLWEMNGITSFKFCAQARWMRLEEPVTIVNRLTEFMSLNCDHLEIISLNLGGISSGRPSGFPAFKDFLRSTHLPHLRELTLKQIRINATLTAKFLEVHSAHLEKIVFDSNTGHDLVLFEAVVTSHIVCKPFPNLHTLEVPEDWARTILFETFTTPTSLPLMKTLKKLRMNGPHKRIGITILNLLPNLEELELGDCELDNAENLRLVSSAVQRLKYLGIHHITSGKPSTSDRGFYNIDFPLDVLVKKWADGLRPFQSLQSLKISHRIWGWPDDALNDSLAKILLEACPDTHQRRIHCMSPIGKVQSVFFAIE